MRRENLIARLLRALSGKTQERAAEELGVHPSLIALIETGKGRPGLQHLEGLARSAGLSLRDAERILDYSEGLRRAQGRRNKVDKAPFNRLAEAVHHEAESALERLRTLPFAGPLPRQEDRLVVEDLWRRLSDLPEDARGPVVQAAESFQIWALCERVCEESLTQASRDVERAASLSHLAIDIADRVQGPVGWRKRIQGFAAAHGANILRVSGDLLLADASFEQAKRLWRAGSDPEALLDLSRLPSLEASLRRDQRRFQDALMLLEQAMAVSRSPGSILINRGFTLEVMGEHWRAIDTLRQAEPLVEREGDARLAYMVRFNLAVSLCQVDRYAEATELIHQVRELATELGDDIFLLRVDWLEGRIAAGTRQAARAKNLLERARQGFAARKMWYDVALALLETAVLDLERGRSAEVKALASDLTQVFDANGVHREALAALRLFQEAAEREAATAELARDVLGYLFKARHDEGLRFTSS